LGRIFLIIYGDIADYNCRHKSLGCWVRLECRRKFVALRCFSLKGVAMGIVYLEDGRMADEFEIGTEPYVLKDALVMMPDVYALLTPDEIAAMKQSRYDNWYAIVTAPPVDAPVEDVYTDPAV
jgi:hypothetical protein